MSNIIEDSILNNYLLKLQSKTFSTDDKFEIIEYISNVHFTKYSNSTIILTNIEKSIYDISYIYQKYITSKNKLYEIKELIQFIPINQKEYIDNNEDLILNNYLLKLQSKKVSTDDKFQIIEYLPNINFTKYSNSSIILENIEKSFFELDYIYQKYITSKNKLDEIKKLIEFTPTIPINEHEYVNNNIAYLLKMKPNI
jgi:hypothetical protein